MRWLRNLEDWLGLYSPGNEDLQNFLKRYRIEHVVIPPRKLEFVRIAVGEWSHQLRAGKRVQVGFNLTQLLAPIAAATATVLASFTPTSAWAVIPAALATVAASLLAAFGLRTIWFLRRRLRHELGQEIVEFVTDSGGYRPLKPDEQVDRLMGKVRDATLAAAPVN